MDKESVALHLGKGKTAEINVDFPDNCQPGDYLLKIRVYNENEECYYTIHQWFEAYTSRQKSQRRKPIPVSAKYVPVMAEPITEKIRMIYLILFRICLSFPVVCLNWWSL